MVCNYYKVKRGFNTSIVSTHTQTPNEKGQPTNSFIQTNLHTYGIYAFSETFFGFSRSRNKVMFDKLWPHVWRNMSAHHHYFYQPKKKKRKKQIPKFSLWLNAWSGMTLEYCDRARKSSLGPFWTHRAEAQPFLEKLKLKQAPRWPKLVCKSIKMVNRNYFCS